MTMFDTIEGVRYERTERPGCPLCGRLETPRVMSVSFGMTASVAECRPCRIAYQTPRPALAASLAYMDMRWRSDDPYVADPELQRDRARGQVKLVAPLASARPRVLDFGAGIGTFVREARDEGWDAVGIERSGAARERAARQNGVDLRPDLEGAGSGFDVITMLDVVEHLRNPAETVRQLRPHLRSGGWMVFETGNWESWRRVSAADGWALYLFDHQFYFSPSSLEATVARAGLVEFELLPGGQITSGPPGFGGPQSTGPDWTAYREAVARWPNHASIDIMLAAARNP